MASTARIDELKKKFDENPRRYFAPLANEFRKSGEIEQAIMICEEFLPQQPAHMSGHIVYGQALYEAGRLPESRAVFETALGLDPENLIALRHLGDIARGQHDGPAARTWYVRVLEADPRNEEIQALIAGLDSESTPSDSLLDFDPSITSAHSQPVGLGIEIEKEIPPMEREWPSKVAARPMIDPSMADTAPAGVPLIPAASLPASALLDGFSMHGFDDTADQAGGAHQAPPAEGLESTEFAPPDEHVPAAELDATLESGVPSFASPTHRIESLDGLQGSGDDPHASRVGGEPTSAGHDFTPLDIDGGLIMASSGDPSSHTPVESPSSLSRDESADALMNTEPSVDSPPAPPVEDARGGESRDDLSFDQGSPAEDAVPTELPPAVIAAEAELIAAGESPEPESVADDADEPESVSRPPFVTETMAELYLAQGFREQALAVYSDLLSASPHDQRLADVVASLTPAAAEEDAGPNVRDFLARIANRRPGNGAAALEPPAYDDFADEASATPELAAVDEEEFEIPRSEPVPVFANDVDEVPLAAERMAALHQPDGSIDALFGNRGAGTSEDSAAAALAQAFGGGSDIAAPPPIVGRPAHAAKGELSLDSVFRDGAGRAPRTSQSFSFDQFFAGGEDRTGRTSPPRGVAMPLEAQDAPAERGADDIEQFNSWLQGLKQR
ncbi:MAG: tetratricopeptide repeat protein [Gemmatimonadota bacterium]|nr:tetratricopeptide repeat protein [Gemmatimonadota bacterium]